MDLKKNSGMIFLIWMLLLSALPALCQSDTGGSIAGQVKDYGGRLFPALITLRNAATGIETQTLSDRDGHFHFAEVAPGTYFMRVNAPGCAPWKAENINVAVGEITQLNPQLSLALPDPHERRVLKISQDDISPAVSDHVAPDSVEDLPNNDRHWSSLASLSSGVTPGADGELSFRGLSPLLNSITVDGLDNNLAFHASERGSANGGYSTAQAAIGEFQINTSNFSAAYGHSAGGAINSITRSGGNHLHGHAVFYDRDAALGSANAFTKLMQTEPIGTTTTPNGPVLYLNGQPITYVETPYKAPDTRLQWSLSAGGPIRRNKLFWFFVYDQHRRDFPAVARANEPQIFFAPPTTQTIETLGARIAGSTNPIAVNCASSPVGQASCAYSTVLNQLGGMLGNVPRTANQTILFPKLDWQLNNRSHLSFQYNHMRRTAPNGALTGASETDGIGSFGSSSTSDDTAVVRWEYFLNPKLLNNARYQYSRDLLAQLAGTPTPFEQQLANNSSGLPPQVSIDRSAGFTFGTRSTLNKPEYPSETRQQIADSVTWIHHRHAFKFGYDYSYVTDAISGLNLQNGSYSYSSLLNFISDFLAPNHCDGTTTGAGIDPCYTYYRQTLGLPVWRFETADYAGFAADDWKISRRFTLSFGLRYEYQALPGSGKTAANPDIPQAGIMPHDRNNLAPRAGFAWDIFGSGRTTLRGGYGIYYGRTSNATVYSALSSTGTTGAQRSYYFRPLDTGAPPFPFVFGSNDTLYTGTGPDTTAPDAIYFDKRFQNPQIDQTQLSLQQELGRRTTLTLVYMGSYAHELPNFIDTNIDLNAAATIYYMMDFTANPQHLGPLKNVSYPSTFYYQRTNPSYGSITNITSESNAIYQGASVRLTRRAARALTINAGYTYAHATDDNPNEATFADLNDVYDPNPADQKIEHGASSFDVRQRVSGGIIASEPWRFRGFADKLLDGYTLAAFGEWHTGLPYTMRTMGSIPTPLCSDFDWLAAGGPSGGGACLAAVNAPGGVIVDTPRPIPGLGKSLNGSGGDDLVPQVGRNTFRYPVTSNLDLRFAKRTRLTERLSIEFIGEAFNALNHQNVNDIQTIGYRLDNQSTSGTPFANTASLSYMSGTTTLSTPAANGGSIRQVVPGTTAAFGGVTNSNSGSVYRPRQIQIGCRLNF